jgi:hypothetical protein
MRINRGLPENRQHCRKTVGKQTALYEDCRKAGNVIYGLPENKNRAGKRRHTR